MPVIIFALVIAALCGSLFYTPDYLHLNVNLNEANALADKDSLAIDSRLDW